MKTRDRIWVMGGKTGLDTMAFGGSALDRAAALRQDAARLAAVAAGALCLPVWRGKPCMDDGGALVWLPADHPVLAAAEERAVFLGRDEGGPRFAADISAWSPEAGAAGVDGGLFDQSEQPHPALPAHQRFCDLRAVMLRLSPREAELAAVAKALLQWHRGHGFCSTCGARSAMAAGGWLRTCPACGAHHFPRTDPVVIMLVTSGNRALLGRSPGWPDGMYSCLAGFVEPGETVEAAVRREVAEETGIPVGPVRYVASQPWPFPASLMIGCAATALAEDITIDPAEIEDALWLTREEMTDVFAGLHPKVKPARKGAIAHSLIRGWLAGRIA